jgi:hypothetical protein
LRLFQFDFPGWQVTIDGQPATTELAKPEGFIVVLVPEGQHVVDVRFGGTPARSLAWAISAFSLLVAAVYGWALNQRRAAQVVDQEDAMPWRGQSVWPATATAGVMTAVFLLLQPLGLFHYESTGLTLDRPVTATDVNFGDQIALLGFDPLTEHLSPGDTLPLSLFWKALRPLTIDYQAFVHIFDASGNLVAQADRLNPGEFPTRRWPLDKYVPDLYTIPLPDDLPPGQYSVATGLWVQSEGWRLPVFSAEGEPIADSAPLFTFEVR